MSKPKVAIVWDRVGDQGQDTHGIRSLDISRAIDFDEIKRLISNQVQIALASGVWEVSLRIEVELKGGPFKQLPFGYGHVVVER